jgi:putative DNA primase/helicase
MMIDWDGLGLGEHRIVCPSCGRGPKDRNLGVTIEHDGNGIAHCFRCGLIESHRPDRPPVMRPGVARGKPIETKHTSLSQYGIDLFAACRPIAGTIGEAYLRARRCALPPPDSDLRFHPALEHKPGKYVGPALVGLITHAVTGKPRSLHRTWITPTGKADVDPPRLTLGNHETTDSVIRLWPSEWVGAGLAVGEGVETCLSLAHAFRPVWATCNALNLGALPVLPGVECLTIAVDGDAAGEAAAAECTARWTERGREVTTVASDPGEDFNDIVCEASA